MKWVWLDAVAVSRGCQLQGGSLALVTFHYKGQVGEIGD